MFVLFTAVQTQAGTFSTDFICAFNLAQRESKISNQRVLELRQNLKDSSHWTSAEARRHLNVMKDFATLIETFSGNPKRLQETFIRTFTPATEISILKDIDVTQDSRELTLRLFSITFDYRLFQQIGWSEKMDSLIEALSEEYRPSPKLTAEAKNDVQNGLSDLLDFTSVTTIADIAGAVEPILRNTDPKDLKKILSDVKILNVTTSPDFKIYAVSVAYNILFHQAFPDAARKALATKIAHHFDLK